MRHSPRAVVRRGGAGRVIGVSYAGDITSAEAWQRLEADPGAALVDVRTDAEWNFVGLPDLGSLGRAPVLVSWQAYPSMAVNGNFADDIAARGIAKDAQVLLLCRSGQRSAAAAAALTAAGYSACYNIADGFEGPPDGEGHRGRVAGWKAAGLPWIQG